MAKVVYEMHGQGGVEIIAHDEKLFSGLKFWMSAYTPSKDHLRKRIEVNGGKVLALETDADYLITDCIGRGKKNATREMISYKFIEDSVEKGELQDPDDFRVVEKATARAGRAGKAPEMKGVSASNKSTRTPYTSEDDNILLWFLSQPEVGALRGNAIYLEIEQHYPHHTYQSWRDHWVKQLSHRYNDRPVAPDGFIPPHHFHNEEISNEVVSTPKKGKYVKKMASQEAQSSKASASQILKAGQNKMSKKLRRQFLARVNDLFEDDRTPEICQELAEQNDNSYTPEEWLQEWNHLKMKPNFVARKKEFESIKTIKKPPLSASKEPKPSPIESTPPVPKQRKEFSRWDKKLLLGAQQEIEESEDHFALFTELAENNPRHSAEDWRYYYNLHIKPLAEQAPQTSSPNVLRGWARVDGTPPEEMSPVPEKPFSPPDSQEKDDVSATTPEKVHQKRKLDDVDDQVGLAEPSKSRRTNEGLRQTVDVEPRDDTIPVERAVTDSPGFFARLNPLNLLRPPKNRTSLPAERQNVQSTQESVRRKKQLDIDKWRAVRAEDAIGPPKIEKVPVKLETELATPLRSAQQESSPETLVLIQESTKKIFQPDEEIIEQVAHVSFTSNLPEHQQMVQQPSTEVKQEMTQEDEASSMEEVYEEAEKEDELEDVTSVAQTAEPFKFSQQADITYPELRHVDKDTEDDMVDAGYPNLAHLDHDADGDVEMATTENDDEDEVMPNCHERLTIDLTSNLYSESNAELPSSPPVYHQLTTVTTTEVIYNLSHHLSANSEDFPTSEGMNTATSEIPFEIPQILSGRGSTPLMARSVTPTPRTSRPSERVIESTPDHRRIMQETSHGMKSPFIERYSSPPRSRSESRDVYASSPLDHCRQHFISEARQPSLAGYKDVSLQDSEEDQSDDSEDEQGSNTFLETQQSSLTGYKEAPPKNFDEYELDDDEEEQQAQNSSLAGYKEAPSVDLEDDESDDNDEEEERSINTPRAPSPELGVEPLVQYSSSKDANQSRSLTSDSEDSDIGNEEETATDDDTDEDYGAISRLIAPKDDSDVESFSDSELSMEEFAAGLAEKYGVHSLYVGYALRRTTLNRKLAEEVVRVMAEHCPGGGAGGDFPLPEMAGVWTEEDDKLMESDSPDVLWELSEKHGDDRFDARIKYLDTLRAFTTGKLV